MRRMGLESAIVVSDGYHIFRVKKMLEFRGLKVYGSPRPSPPRSGFRQWWLYFGRRRVTFCGRRASGFSWPISARL